MAQEDIRVFGQWIRFEDGRPGIVSGGEYNSPYRQGYCWAKSLDGQIAHQYSIAAIQRRIANNHLVFPLS